MIREYVRNNSLVIEFLGDFILNNGSLYSELLQAVKKYDKKKIILDLSSLDSFDECSVKNLLRLIDKYSPRGYSFSIFNPRKLILKQLVDKNVVDRVEICTDMEKK